MDFSDEMFDEILKIFQVESEEIISKINNSLLELEKNPNNKDVILSLFRDAHTIKGASRMVGFNNVQTIAHKMEDILGLAKENKILLNAKVVDVLYKTVDFLSDLIEKSIEKGREIYNEDISKQVAMLENIQEYAQSVDPGSEQTDFNSEILTENIKDINNHISEMLFLLMKIESKMTPDLIKELLFEVEKLFKIFEKIGHFDIKKSIEDIKVKLEFTTKGSNTLSRAETKEINHKLDSVINKLIPLYELYNLEIVDYYSAAFEKGVNDSTHTKESTTDVEKGGGKYDNDAKESIADTGFEVNHEPIEEITKQEIKTKPDVQPEVQQIVGQEASEYTDTFETVESIISSEIEENSSLTDIQAKLLDLYKNGSSLNEMQNFLINFENSCSEDNVKKILQKIIKIMGYAIENEVRLDEETMLVIKQSIESCDNILKQTGEIADNELVSQRLDIIQQILQFSHDKNVDYDFATKTDNKIKVKKATDFSEIFNTGEIRTLRVESSKLDTLVNQVNELTFTKIKSQKHLHELNNVNAELLEWQKNSIKALNYLKYYDKKYFQSSGANNPLSFFVKQLLGLFSDNNKKVQDAVMNISTLHRTIQEDNAKTGLVIDNLQDMVKNVRVLPLATVFHLFGRMVRDIAQEKNKQIELEIIGSETSTDKKIIEEIKAPLIHIIRNSIDHGIETPDERIVIGKDPTGKIILRAAQADNKVIIEIEDDGRGINVEKIKEKAVQKGFLTQEEVNSMTQEQITNIIFAPGFSTGEEITNISGRGIGLDVVQSKIAQLNGKVRIISELNKGCCVQIELPTTMATIKVFLVKSSEQTFAVPMEVIDAVLRKDKNEIMSNDGKSVIVFKEKTIPLYDLADTLKLPKLNSDKTKETILIIENGNKKIALAVDKLLGDQEVLHKKLAPPIYKLKNISGITTLASGETCLILNIADIINTTTCAKIKTICATTKTYPHNNTYNILLVDDSITTRTLEKNILEKAGYKTQTAQNPIEAFEILENTSFNLIISDIEMPEMNGLEFLNKLKTDEKYADIPVIMVSSLMSPENKKKALELGAKKCITKGEFNQDDFLDGISTILHNEG